MTRSAIRMRVKIAFGTDAGEYTLGENAKQFALLVREGMKPAQALQSATIRASELLGLENEIGTLEAGKAADVVAVRGNPLENIRTMERMLMVFRDGTVMVDPRRTPE